MNWNEVFVLKDDGLLYWSDQYLSRPKMFNISKEKPAGHILATQGSALISDTLRVSMMQLL